MARPLNKLQLLDFAQREYQLLIDLISTQSDSQRDIKPIFENRTTKDIVAHLYAWQLLELNWYKEGMKGQKPVIPAPGYSFKDTPALNEKLYQDYKDIKWDTLLKKFTELHNQLLTIINKHTEEELFTKKKYIWTGTTNMAVYFRSALSSHYVWARNLIRKNINSS